MKTNFPSTVQCTLTSLLLQPDKKIQKMFQTLQLYEKMNGNIGNIEHFSQMS